MEKTNDGERNDWMEVKELHSEHDEVDSDVNEDAKRELQLDASFQDWYRNIEYWVKQQEEITNVPKENVFDAAVTMDEDEK
ncbi:hypothetical protein [Paenibacillus thermotolerans]|uniref:hypothetical protein n=1 Tax=Paenibacillus thermotolerans TaxID=3027807 RepID=UPI002367EDDA|nr:MULTISPECIES: hypothetical protein [unclassified Paenibacillus]